MKSLNTIRLLAAFAVVAALAGCGKKAEPGNPSGATGDREKMQGMWAIEAVDDGRAIDPEDRKDMKSERFKVDGDTFTVFERGDEIKFTFALDENANPKTLTLTEVIDPNERPRFVTSSKSAKAAPAPPREPDKINCLYKFEGDHLILAISKGDKGERPTEFKGRETKFDKGKVAEPGVTVLTLKKTDEPPPPRRPRGGATTRIGTYRSSTYPSATKK